MYVTNKRAIPRHSRDHREYITDSTKRFKFTRLFHRSQATVIQSGYLIMWPFLLIQLYSATACPEAASQMHKAGKS